jgi:hypothetical protein
MRDTALPDVTPCSLMGTYQRLEELTVHILILFYPEVGSCDTSVYVYQIARYHFRSL